jgi:hypothetical protein
MGTTVNYANPKTDSTVKIFDEFYGYNEEVPSQEYDAVWSYFRSVFDNLNAAGNFTVTLFRDSSPKQYSGHDLVATDTGTEPARTDLDLELLSQQQSQFNNFIGIEHSHHAKLLRG